MSCFLMVAILMFLIMSLFTWYQLGNNTQRDVNYTKQQIFKAKE
jgi:hypothetical protein